MNGNTVFPRYKATLIIPVRGVNMKYTPLP